MKREIIVCVELDDNHERILEDIRWKHIDFDALIEEELEEKIKEIIEGWGNVHI